MMVLGAAPPSRAAPGVLPARRSGRPSRHRHDRLPGDPHRPLPTPVRSSSRPHPTSQHRNQRRGHGVPADLGQRLRRARPRARHPCQLAQRARWTRSSPRRASPASRAWTRAPSRATCGTRVRCAPDLSGDDATRPVRAACGWSRSSPRWPVGRSPAGQHGRVLHGGAPPSTGWDGPVKHTVAAVDLGVRSMTPRRPSAACACT
ncbi:hypothetical protein QJS66_03945 [Kocuria rhizophila]|nr:hypothetical protein QJS66_03945 [Kocuria rhizophila]